MNIYYVYAHITKDTKETFYIGKGKGRRAFSKRNRNKFWNNIANKHGYIIEFIKESLSEQEAFNLEIDTIKSLRPKANLTDGGQGTSGLKHDPELVVWRNENNRKINKTYEGKLKKSLAQKEAQNRPEVKAKIQSSRRKTIVAIKAGFIPNPWKGQKRSNEFKKRMSDMQKGEKGYWYGKTTAVAKKIINLDTGVIFSSMTAAAASVNGAREALWQSLKKGRKFKKFRFAYYKESN